MGFLRVMLLKLGFDRVLVDLFFECISSAKYQICHAGKQYCNIISGRGIRQGDPLSSYLFLVCMEGFTSLIQDYERRRLLSGIQVARGVPTISHMFFADDSYILCKAISEDTTQVVNLPHIFEKVLGQKINREKSYVFFSSYTTTEVRHEICNILGFAEATENATY